MLNKHLFILAHQLGCKSFYPTYQFLMKNQWSSYAELKENQNKELKQLVSFVYENVPYYRNLFKNLNLFPNDIRTLEDLEKLPVLTKDIIKQHWEDFKPANLSSMQYDNDSTGGSTGTPFQYRLSKQDRFLGGALLYRGWGYGGYQLGDRMVILAGSSLDVGKKSYLEKKAHEITRNIRKLSSYDMGEKEMMDYAEILNTFKPRFIRGYASSIYFYAKWLEKNDISVSFPDAVFTTAEKLFPDMRKTIGRVFDCDVFDGYGLNDGGVGAHECPEHTGLHIDTERSIMEVVDSSGFQIDEGQGQILATSLHNYATPFLRYATGDEGFILSDSCSCGRGHRLLKEVLGRQHTMLITPEGKHIHGTVFSWVMDDVSHVKEFQVVQKSIEDIQINIVKEPGFNEETLEKIKQLILTKSPNWNIEFVFVDEIKRTGAGKYKFIMNEMLNA